MRNLMELYDIALGNDVEVYDKKLNTMKAFSLPGSIVIDSKQLPTTAELKVCFAHELGHELKSAFYNIRNTLETRGRQEERATRWAVDTLVPADLLLSVIEKGYTEIYELAEYFNVTEDFIRDAIRIHQQRGDLDEIYQRQGKM